MKKSVEKNKGEEMKYDKIKINSNNEKKVYSEEADGGTVT